MPSPREVSLGILLGYLEEWLKDSEVPYTGHGKYNLAISIHNRKITHLDLIHGKASISLK